jgi:hypothetical protein
MTSMANSTFTPTYDAVCGAARAMHWPQESFVPRIDDTLSGV